MVSKSWKCAAITNGMTFYSNGTIAPCFAIDHTYRKSITQAFDNPFEDLNTGHPPPVCQNCISVEAMGIQSHRQRFNESVNEGSGLQIADIRNFNLCNAKCRTCGPQNSSQWAKELEHDTILIKQELTDYKKLILNPSLRQVHYTGGEPFINSEQWDLLEELVALGFSKTIDLHYNSNLSTLKYKDKDIRSLWENFRHISVTASIDAIGEKFSYIRSGLDWAEVDQNLRYLLEVPKISVNIGTTVSLLNLWFIPELLDYYNGVCPVTLTDLYYPESLALTSIPDNLQTLALNTLDQIDQRYHDKNKIKFYKDQILNNHSQYLFRDTVNHVLLLDKIRNEKLFDLLPFQSAAQKVTFL